MWAMLLLSSPTAAAGTASTFPPALALALTSLNGPDPLAPLLLVLGEVDGMEPPT